MKVYLTFTNCICDILIFIEVCHSIRLKKKRIPQNKVGNNLQEYKKYILTYVILFNDTKFE